MDKIQVELLDKHRNYLQFYIPNDTYWGIGIEHETYFEMSNPLRIDPDIFYSKKAVRERYSIDYYLGYKPNVYESSIEKMRDLKKNNLKSTVPLLLNSCSFTRADCNNEHVTTYSKYPTPNHNYSGKTLYEFICEKDSYFKDEYMKSFIFDGDTIEFISLNFYKKTIQDVIEDLEQVKKEFMYRLQKIFNKYIIYTKYGHVDFCKKNHGFVSLMTNINNCSIFNNMTYHLNFTLPTKLTNNCLIKDYPLFISQHKNAIHIIQWIEPMLIAIFGTGDILSEVNPNISPTSQRCAKSRYIGIGTYDTDVMTPGKILQISSTHNHLSNMEGWWYNQYYKESDYKREEEIGLDINFHKHKNHGIELRIFDYFDESKLEEVLGFIVLLLDHSLNKKFKSPVRNMCWNKYVYSILKNRNAEIDSDLILFYQYMFDCIGVKIHNSFDLYSAITKSLLKKYKNKGICYNSMIRNTKTTDKKIKKSSCSIV
jgi:hypothetical protein